MSRDEMLALADYLDDLESKMLAADADMLIDEETAPSIWAYRIRSRLSASLLDGLGEKIVQKRARIEGAVVAEGGETKSGGVA